MLQSNKVVPLAHKLLRVDYGFMISIYPLLGLWLWQLQNVVRKRWHRWLKALAWLQIISFGCDMTENWVLLQSLATQKLQLPIATYHVIEMGKWGFSLLGGLVVVFTSLNWVYTFLMDLKKAQQ